MAQPALSKTLADLGLRAREGREVTVTGLAVDNRQIRPGMLFAALPGTRVHGAEFITRALDSGAAAVLTDPVGARLAAPALAARPDVAVVVVQEPRAALAQAAALWFGRQPEVTVAVTGTNGKTSIASFTRQIWAGLGHEAINLGTTGVEGAWAAPLNHTTPDAITLHRALAEAVAAGVTHAALEASSHGLDQHRLDGVHLAAAAFTNLTQDHLDYHADMDAYFAAKAALFDRVLPAEGCAVVNCDDARAGQVIAIAETRGQRVIKIGRGAECDLQILGQRFDATGQELRFRCGAAIRQERLELIGGFQAGNALIAAGLAIGAGEEPEAALDQLRRLVTVRGRMQLVARRAHGASVFVDYAHTPDALATALAALRPHVMGRLVVVFGAGGDRDRTKRPLMGAAARHGADVVFVTDDNPRSEDPAAIRAAILAECPDAHEVGDRAEAILRGVDALGPGDALLIAGKGHETGQVIGSDIFPFDDAEQASVAVAALDGALQ